MTLAMQSSNYAYKNTFRHTLKYEIKRHAPFMIIYCVICALVILLPAVLTLWGNHLNQSTTETEMNYYFAITIDAVTVLLFASFIFALLQYAFLTQKRAMDVFAALPVRRETAARARMAAAFLILAVPVLIISLIVFFLNVLFGGFHIHLVYELLYNYFSIIVYLLIPYSVVSVFSALSGTILEMTLYPIIFLFAPNLISSALLRMAKHFLYGFYFDETLASVASATSPFRFYQDPGQGNGITDSIIWLKELQKTSPEVEVPTFFSAIQESLLSMGIWFLICTGLLILSVVLLKRRKTEIAGIKAASPIPHSIISVMVSVLCGMIFINLFSRIYQNISDVMIWVSFFIVTILAYFCYQCIILRSVYAAFRSWKPLCASICMVALVISIFASGGFGAYSRQFKPDEIQSVSIQYTGRNFDPTEINIMDYSGEPLSSAIFPNYNVDEAYNFSTNDKEVIQIVSEFQNKMVAAKGKPAYNEMNSYSAMPIEITMKLKNGSTVKRQYTYNNPEYGRIIARLMENEMFIRSCNYAFRWDFAEFTDISMMDLFSTKEEIIKPEQIDLKKFQKALQEDILAEKVEQLLHPEGPAYGSISLTQNKYDYEDDVSPSVTVPIKAHYKNTFAYLESAGLTGYLTPDFSQIQEMAIWQPGPKDMLSHTDRSDYYDLMSIYTEVSMDDSLYLFTNDIFFPSTQFEIDILKNSEAEQLGKVEFTDDPEKIQAILSKCYSEHEYTPNDTFIGIVSKNSSASFILPQKAQ